ncbi:hypothetical protein EVAR_62008_1 [Eumeta japonica]|uniref:Uncharacterized protein n=1 Tax=Eumeta variegata TaxID=151549 RepID=A0A4C1ZVK8_EUMVA|nr:hypothetical protein EVAR_62008_1 [Eumeta japonica]
MLFETKFIINKSALCRLIAESVEFTAHIDSDADSVPQVPQVVCTLAESQELSHVETWPDFRWIYAFYSY